MTTTNLLRQALDALKRDETFYKDPRGDSTGPVIDAIRAHLEQPAPEPVAWYDTEMDCAYTATELGGGTAEGLMPLYASPPPGAEQPAPAAVERKGLTGAKFFLPPMPTPDATVYGDGRTVRGHAVLTSKVRTLQIETANAALEFAAKICEGEAALGLDDERAYNGKLMAEAIRAHNIGITQGEQP